jgi:hypothetical protein
MSINLNVLVLVHLDILVLLPNFILVLAHLAILVLLPVLILLLILVHLHPRFLPRPHHPPHTALGEEHRAAAHIATNTIQFAVGQHTLTPRCTNMQLARCN